MKKLICILMMLLFAFPAFAAETDNPFSPYVLTVPEGVTLENNEGTHAFVSGKTRVVAMVIERVPDADPAEAVVRLMRQFEPDAVHEDELTLDGGCVALSACSEDKYGEGLHQWNVMILSPEGDLLILSGYDLEGDDEAVRKLLDSLLSSLSLNGTDIVIK